MGKKKTGFLPVSTTAELDFRGQPSIPQVQEFQFPSSWAPITPEKPNLPEPRPICADRQENQPSNANWFLPERFSPGFPQETQFHGIGPCSEPSNSIDMNRGENFGNWEADLAWKSPVEDQISSDLSLDSSFRSLLALADAAASTQSANATRQGNGGPFITIFKSQFGGSWFESNSTAPPPANANQEMSFGSNLWNNNICAPDTYLYRNSTPSRPTYDLNSPPTALTEAFFSTNVYSQYAPITPDQSKKAENKLAHDIPALSADQETHQERNTTQGNEVATTRVEVDEQQLTKDLSIAAVSTELDENHNPDKGSNLGIDLNRTPQQKPRRKKHRPKVVIEGKPKMTPKPVTPKPSGHKESLTGKRKYVRRNGLDKNSVTPTAQVTGGNTDPKTAPSTAKSCRRMLNFDSESQVREESSSCRPESNQNGESQAQNFCARVEPRSTVQRGQQMEEKVDKTQGGIAYRLTRSVRKLLDDYLSLPELQGPIATTPAKTTLPLEKMKDHDEKGRAKGKCQIVFSDETHDKQVSTMQMAMNTDLPSAPRSPNDSNCSSSSSACFTEEERARGLKRGHSCTINEAEPSRTNVIGGHYSSLNEYMTMLPANAYHNYGFQGMLFPTIYKKKRTEKGHCSNTSSTLSTLETNGRFSAAQFNSSCTSTKNTSLIDAKGKQQGLECKLALDQKGRMTKKRSKGPTRVRDFASLIVGCNQYPTFPAQGAPTSSDMQIYETSHHPYACMEALVADSHATKTTKKRTKRNSFASSVTTDGIQKRMPTMDTMAKYLDGLDINMENIQVTYQEQGQLVPYDFRNEERSARVPYNLRYVDQNALVLYRRDGTVMPFEGTFNPVRKRRPRPKVDLDEETSRVWKLLLESISSEGIDGTDEEKAKWWEEERRVFRGRADSFIARMHLVQGDRRFSPWKGSVVDSVIGVFLTQNVSDHLSSSAFMSLAARFPLKCEGSDTPCFEETTTWVKEPEVCIWDPEESIKWHEEKSNQPARNGSSMPHHDMDCSAEKQVINCNELLEETSKWVKEPEVCILDPEDSIKWHEEKSNQPACNGSSTTLCDMDGSVEKEDINCNELLGSSSGAVRSAENLKCKSTDVYGNGQEIYEKSTGNREVIQLTEAVESLMGEKREMDDVHSPQNSAGSSQNSADSSMAETDERIGSFVQDYSKADPETRSHTNRLVGSSFLELLQRETLCGLHNHKIGDASSCKENGYSYMEGSECDAQNQNKDRSANPNASLRPIISSSNYQLQMNSNARVQEAESLDILREESLFSDISMKNQENCISEQSGVTAESVNQATVQNVMSVSFQDAPKSPSENNHACSSLQGELNKVFQSRDRPLGNPKDNIQFQTQEQHRRMQQVLEVPNLSGDTLDVTDSTSIVNNPKSTEHNAVESSLKDRGYLPGKAIHGISSETSSVKRGRIGKQKQNQNEWDGLRLQAQAKGKRERTTKTMDSLDYEAVRCADVNEIAYTIRERGMNNMLAERIKDFLNRLVREHGSIDLEWLRDVPPDKAKEYLLSFRGLGLKSVECVRLLTLHHLAFPVDTNVGRIAVRLGWVPLQPLPESLQLHLLELYPVLESIQRYLWPRLCKLDQRTLYELHYQMITFGKVFCTKSKPNCNACPMRGECRHFASAFASARLALPGPEEKSIVSATEKVGANQYPVEGIQPLQLPLLQANEQLQAQSQINNSEPIIEVPATPEPTVEMPATPEPEQQDIEDLFSEDPEEIPTIKLNIEELTQNLQNFMQQNMELQEGEVSKALVALTPEAASLPVPKLKNVSRLRTEHRVYELPDSHPLLEGLDKREPDDPCSYLLAIWTPGETPNSIQPPERSCSSQQFGNLCCEETCFSCSSIREANSQTVRGTLLIPCRTAMRGSFPLNGTYFQVNEVFADHESSINPMDVPRVWLWNLPRRTVYFGTSIPTIFKGLSTESIQYCFWKGFVCVRGFDQKTRAPRPLMARLHFPASKLPKTKSKTDDKQE